MKKDIIIHPPLGIQLAIVPNAEDSWEVYLVNHNEHSLHTILVVTTAADDVKQSSTLRYFLESITPQSCIKVETIYGDVATLTNTVSISYYVGHEIFEKEFIFHIPQLDKLSDIVFVNQRGYIIH